MRDKLRDEANLWNGQESYYATWPLRHCAIAPLCLCALVPLRPCAFSQLNGLSPNGLWKGESLLLLPPPLGVGFGGMVVIITREIELSRITLETIGLVYVFLDNILFLLVFNCKEMISE